jgi:hypothetical protein
MLKQVQHDELGQIANFILAATALAQHALSNSGLALKFHAALFVRHCLRSVP